MKGKSEHSTQPAQPGYLSVYLCVPTLVETASSLLLDWKGTKSKIVLKVMAISQVQEVQFKQNGMFFCLDGCERVLKYYLYKN